MKEHSLPFHLHVADPPKPPPRRVGVSGAVVAAVTTAACFIALAATCAFLALR